MNKHNDYMYEAYIEAKKAYKKGEVPVGCIIVYNDRIIARAHNTRESKQISINHAEILAIKKACKKMKTWRLEECSMYVTLEPCAMCAGAIVQSRIKTLVYAADDLKAGFCGSVNNTVTDERLNHQVELIAGVMKDECSCLIKDFFKELRDKKKSTKR